MSGRAVDMTVQCSLVPAKGRPLQSMPMLPMADVVAPDVSIFVLVPHVFVLLLPVYQQNLHLINNASDAIGDLHNAAQGGVLIP